MAEKECTFKQLGNSISSESTSNINYTELLRRIEDENFDSQGKYFLEVVFSYAENAYKSDRDKDLPPGRMLVEYMTLKDDLKNEITFQAIPGGQSTTETSLRVSETTTPSSTTLWDGSATTSVPSTHPELTIEGAETTSEVSLSKETGTPNNASNSTPEGASGRGLKTGEKAGIAVGAVLGVLAIVALIFLCLRRRKSKRKTPGGYFGDAPGSANDLREKDAGVGIATISVSASPSSDDHAHHNRDASMIGRGNSERVVDGASLERGDVGGHAAPVVGVGGAVVARKPIGSRSVSDENRIGREGAMSSQSQVLSEEERARWDEEERRLDEDIAEAERRRLAQ